ncbi:DhnA family fructose-bisphosphate aldolase class Ia [Thermocatellispora tengchongensis]|uniref:DhnA family fructose-bisphosphate aldolase class Ia n=1 Tax=Thermocatellispora tengchongensis TaxID=1073253 RepID=A0A840P9C8_9ACTN|nr:deoxyribose-phosphate aldolase [Thermocatellispora tengchongensis]MBB5134040.1 DhnA family fructose-bisphosphate aldolase class Ia [Thermocatellispora tengchongensis]
MADHDAAPTLTAPGIRALAEARARFPERIAEAAAARRPGNPRRDGQLLIIAADHPARGALGVGGRPLAMGSRVELLERLCVALSRPGVDGLLATPDVVEDLLLLGALHDKIVVGSMNRGGLHGSVFEFDDRFTAYDTDAIVRMRLDGGKMLCRIGLDDRGTPATLEAIGRAVTELAGHGLIAMLEPFWSRWVDGSVRHDLSPDAVIHAINVAQGLGATSARTWLKIPVVAEMERVMAATTLPTLLLGGDPGDTPDQAYSAWREALRLPGVRGLVVGRALLYPPDDDVAAAVDTATSMLEVG